MHFIQNLPTKNKQTKMHTCELCDKEFTSSSSMNRHKRLHAGVMPYACNICNKEFAYSSSLTHHKAIHLGERSFSCDICQKMFNSKPNLTKHIRIHSNEKPFKCDSCEKSFSQRGILINHKKIHSSYKPYSCDICEKSFKRADVLATHKLTHSVKKPFSCPTCRKGFNKPTHLNKHMKVHERATEIVLVKEEDYCPDDDFSTEFKANIIEADVNLSNNPNIEDVKIAPKEIENFAFVEHNQAEEPPNNVRAPKIYKAERGRCSYCDGYYAKTNMARHQKTCQSRRGQTSENHEVKAMEREKALYNASVQDDVRYFS